MAFQGAITTIRLSAPRLSGQQGQPLTRACAVGGPAQRARHDQGALSYLARNSVSTCESDRHGAIRLVTETRCANATHPAVPDPQRGLHPALDGLKESPGLQSVRRRSPEETKS